MFESVRSWRNYIVLAFSFYFLFSSGLLQADEKHLNRAGRWVACRVSGSYIVCCLVAEILSGMSPLFRLFDHFFFRQVDPHGRGHRLHRAQHGHEARGGGDPVQDVLAKAPGRQDLQEELPHDDEGVLPRSSAAKNLLGIIVLRLGLQIVWWSPSLLTDWFQGRTQKSWSDTYSECTTPIRWVGPSLSGSRFLRNIVGNISIRNSNSDDIPNVGL